MGRMLARLLKTFFVSCLIFVPAGASLAIVFFIAVTSLSHVFPEEGTKYAAENLWGWPLVIYSYIIALLGTFLYQQGMIVGKKNKPL
ncbi:MAG: hypothetical protein HYT93_00845 [Parcubacteria group bacterium]|nr:hypothetical protein [Parcubacteria group bacterium]